MKIAIPSTRKTGLSFATAILLLCTNVVVAQTIDYGKTYVNITKGTEGGTVETGDTLEIRATFVVGNGTTVDSCGFFDVVPTGTTYIPGTLVVRTNEGKVYKSFTDATGDDEAWISGSNIVFHLGFSTDKPATAAKRGRIKSSDKPSFYGGTCITVATYRVVVTAAIGSSINTGSGTFTYKSGGGGSPVSSIAFASNIVAVYTNYGVCTNSVGANVISAEFGGTFGSGKDRYRGPSTSVPSNYGYKIFTGNTPNDYYYGIANNTSTLENYTTVNTWGYPDNTSPSHRVFNVWDIIGDHTDATDELAGNAPADTVASSDGGYMLVVNASYKTDTAFQYTVTNLCPNTYYELSAWLRNICPKCGCDVNGTGASGGSSYIPTGPGDSSGVKPNLTFGIDGVDYYTTGNIDYTGQWVKKAFTYLTGPSQTSLVLTIRNNAPGGGGNDWAIDDISFGTCTPDLDMKPSPSLYVCSGNLVEVYSIIKSYFPNYIHYRWEKSSDGGTTWTRPVADITGAPVYDGSQYIDTVKLPAFVADASMDNDMYRIRIASTASNLDNEDCSLAASTSITLDVDECTVLNTTIQTFQGRELSRQAQLSWTVTNESSVASYDVESSVDGTSFQKLATVAAAGLSTYSYTDPLVLDNSRYYRIRINENDKHAYSHIVLLNGHLNFDIRSLLNPFSNNIRFELSCPSDAVVTVKLVDMYGRTFYTRQLGVSQGINTVNIEGITGLASGTYILQVANGSQVVNRRVVKAN